MKKFCKCTHWLTPEPIPAPVPAPISAPSPAPIVTTIRESIQVAAPERQNQMTISQKKILDEETCMNILNLHMNPEMIKAKKICSASVKGSDKNGFSCVLSMQDAKVMYITASITTALGFSKGMWIGRPFINFVHPMDRNILESQISNGIITPKSNNSTQLHEQASVTGEQLSTMVCRIRRYTGLNSCGSKERVITYKPFMLKFFFKTLTEDEKVVYVVIEGSALLSAFTTPNEVVTEPIPFVIRHSPNGKLDYIDPESVPYLGYLPQDIAQKDMMQLYYPSDLIYLRQVYETIMREGGLERSKPYRIKAQNGDFLTLETEWSSFINPLSKKLEYVIAKHFIIEGPKNPDVFQTPELAINYETPREEDIKAQAMRDYIVNIMNEEPDLDSCYSIPLNHDYLDSDTNNETPLSYNQVNNDDNLLRFFEKHEEYTQEEINALAISVNTSIEEMKKKSPDVDIKSPKDMDKIGSISRSSAATVPKTISECSFDGYQSLELTESLINKHNVEMQQELLKSYSKAHLNKSERALIDSKQRINEHLVRCNAPFQPSTASLSNVDQKYGIKRHAKDADEDTQKHRCISPRHGTIKPYAPTLPSFSHGTAVTQNMLLICTPILKKTPQAMQQNNMPQQILHSEQISLSNSNNEELKFPQVDGQKSQLNVELQCVSANHSLDEGITGSSSSDEEIPKNSKASTSNNPQQNRAFNSVMIYEDHERLRNLYMSEDSGNCSS